MTVILKPERSVPVVAFNVWIDVGSADETPDEKGLAHVHEHMLFKGTERRDVGEIARSVESAGGRINAFTSFDETCYYVVMASRYFETGLDILSDAVQHSEFDADQLQSELEVIQEEIKRGKDNPGRDATLKLFETAYSEHPYRIPVIGTSESVDSFERSDVVNFYNKHYVPDNTTLVLVGDFDSEEARTAVERYFGEFDGEPGDKHPRADEPEQSEPRVVIDREDVSESYLRIGFHIPEIVHDDVPALDLLGAILGYGRSSRLHRSVYRDSQLVRSISASAYPLKDPGLFYVTANYDNEDQNEGHRRVVNEILGQIYLARSGEFAPEEIERARAIIESQELYSQETVEGRAMKIGRYKMMTGDARYEEKYYRSLREVTSKDLQRVAETYLSPDNVNLVLKAPAEGEKLDPEVLLEANRTAFEKSTDAASKSVGAPNLATGGPSPDEDGFVRVELSDGPTVVVQVDRRVETFAARAYTLGGVRHETPETNGINPLIARLLTRGTDDRDSEQISSEIEAMAGSIGGTSGRNTLGLKLKGLSRYFEPCFKVFADCLTNPTFPERELAREKAVQLQQINARRDQLGKVNHDQFCELFFGEHPYGLPKLGTEQSVAGLDRSDLEQYYRERLGQGELVLSVVGDVDAREVIDLVDSYVADQTDRTSASHDMPRFEAPRDRRLASQRLDKQQAHVTVGFNAPQIDDPDYYGLKVLGAVLSGQGGRLFYKLRDQQSLGYSVYPRMLLGLDAGVLSINIGTSPNKINKALRGITEEIQSLREDSITRQELGRAKRYLLGNYDIRLQKNGYRASQSALDELYGLGFKRMTKFDERIEGVDASDIERLIDNYLDLDTAVVSITAPEGAEVPQDVSDLTIAGD